MTRKSTSPFDGYPDNDTDWCEDQWNALLQHLIDTGLVTWHQISALVLGHLNPSQIGTSIASNKSFQKHFPKRKIWTAVRQWHFDQSGMCSDCGTRLELQADHIISKEIVGKVGMQIVQNNIDEQKLFASIYEILTKEMKHSQGANNIPSDLIRIIGETLREAILNGARDQETLAKCADRLENMILRCRRCNVIRRPSHKLGGKTFLTAEAALMWILLVKRPSTYREFHDLCRSYGMTMANIRFQEAWAMAIWLARDRIYSIDPSSTYK